MLLNFLGRYHHLPTPELLGLLLQQNLVGLDCPGLHLLHAGWLHVEPDPEAALHGSGQRWLAVLHPRIVTGNQSSQLLTL